MKVKDVKVRFYFFYVTMESKRSCAREKRINGMKRGTVEKFVIRLMILYLLIEYNYVLAKFILHLEGFCTSIFSYIMAGCNLSLKCSP